MRVRPVSGSTGSSTLARMSPSSEFHRSTLFRLAKGFSGLLSSTVNDMRSPAGFRTRSLNAVGDTDHEVPFDLRATGLRKAAEKLGLRSVFARSFHSSDTLSLTDTANDEVAPSQSKAMRFP